MDSSDIMTTQQPLLKALFPDLPRDNTISDRQGELQSTWSLFFQQLVLSLQSNYKSEGILFPPLTAAQITTIQGFYTPYIGQTYQKLLQNLPDISGQTVFDTTNRVPKQFIITFDTSPAPIVTAASWKTFTLT